MLSTISRKLLYSASRLRRFPTVQPSRSCVLEQLPFGSSADDMELTKVSARLTQFAPPSLAGSWDNTGLLVEPSAPHQVNRIMLTNDLTDPVMDEALEKKADMILSYHPPIFVPLKVGAAQLADGKWLLILKMLEDVLSSLFGHYWKNQQTS